MLLKYIRQPYQLYRQTNRNIFGKAVNKCIPYRTPIDPRGEFGPWGKYIESSLPIMAVMFGLSCCYKIYEQGLFFKIPKN